MFSEVIVNLGYSPTHQRDQYCMCDVYCVQLLCTRATCHYTIEECAVYVVSFVQLEYSPLYYIVLQGIEACAQLLSIKDTHYYTVEESAVMCPVIVHQVFEIQRFNSIILSVFCIISRDTNHY